MTKLKNIAVAIATIVIFTNITHAQALKASYSVNYEEPLAVKYLGNDENYLMFEVSVQPQMDSKALFAIADRKEGELYSSTVTPSFKVKTVKIEKRDDQELNFKLVIGKKTYSKSFSINTNEVETTTVAESDITML
ncbi:MAG: hypothetical protein H7Z13_03005 [Ferruginibacter sp.]|nr:hypothetical protein [Ferruginibacter sp.]